jgi:hypothetical protein
VQADRQTGTRLRCCDTPAHWGAHCSSPTTYDASRARRANRPTSTTWSRSAARTTGRSTNRGGRSALHRTGRWASLNRRGAGYGRRRAVGVPGPQMSARRRCARRPATYGCEWCDRDRRHQRDRDRCARDRREAIGRFSLPGAVTLDVRAVARAAISPPAHPG